MPSLTQWTWVWVNSWSWWWTRRPGVLQSIGSQRIRHDWATKVNWTEPLQINLFGREEYIIFITFYCVIIGEAPIMWLSGKESTCNSGDTGDAGPVLGSGWAAEGGKVNPLQYSCQENHKDREGWQATVHGVTKSRTQLSNWTYYFISILHYITVHYITYISHYSNSFTCNLLDDESWTWILRTW